MVGAPGHPAWHRETTQQTSSLPLAYQRTGEHVGIVAVQSVFCRNAKCNLLITKVAFVLFEFLLLATKDEVETDSKGVMAEIQWCDEIEALRKAA